MGWKYRVGKTFDSTLQTLLKWRVPGSGFYPAGHKFAYDVARLYTLEGRPGPTTIFDVGANVGDVALFLHGWFPEATIHAFEPIGATFKILEARTAHIPQIRRHHLALGAAAERREVVLRENSELNTLVTDSSITHQTTGERETVTIDTLDAFCARGGIGTIDLLKLDAQGFEEAIIAGGAATLPRTRFLYAEAGFRPENPDCARFDHLFPILYPRGFFVCGFYDPLRHDDCKLLMAFCNVLFLNKRWVLSDSKTVQRENVGATIASV
jgi:FkbM family methyltransferase